jgi:hypothetical protein
MSALIHPTLDFDITPTPLLCLCDIGEVIPGGDMLFNTRLLVEVGSGVEWEQGMRLAQACQQ